MRESRTYGFVRGAHSDMRPYRDLYLLPMRPVVAVLFGKACNLTRPCGLIR